MVYPPTFRALVIHDPVMDDEGAALPKVLEALACRGSGLVHPYCPCGVFGATHPP